MSTEPFTPPQPMNRITTQEGATFEPWTDGWAIGFKVTSPDGDVRYVYLNPSSDNDADTPANVFLYIGQDAQQHNAGYAVFFDLFTGEAPEDVVRSARPDLRVSYNDIRQSLALILAAGTTDPQEVLASLDDAVSNNLGD